MYYADKVFMTTKNRKHRKKNKQARNILKKPKRIAGLKDAHRLACKRSITKRGQERQAFQIGRVWQVTRA